MALLLREDDVRALLPMSDCITTLEKAFGYLAEGKAFNHPRIRFSQPNGNMHVLTASIPPMDVMGHKTYTVFRDGMKFMVALYSAHDGLPLALIEAEWLGGMRTGAASALATNYLARPNSSVVGLLGAGKQATMQLVGICAVRPVARVFVYSRHPAECEAFCDKMARYLNIEVQPSASQRDAVEFADIVITATTSAHPVFAGDWLPPGCHINAIGSNWPNRRELDTTAVQRSNLVVTDSLEQAKVEAGDLLIPAGSGDFDWDKANELSDLVAGLSPRRKSADDITLYKGLGTGLEDIATAGLVYRLAREQGRGEEISL